MPWLGGRVPPTGVRRPLRVRHHAAPQQVCHFPISPYRVILRPSMAAQPASPPLQNIDLTKNMYAQASASSLVQWLLL